MTQMQEYYIRKEGDEDSRGPFTVEQLSSLVEAGQVDRQTFYYDAVSEKWIELQANAELMAALFPIKRKLTIRAKEAAPAINLAPPEEEAEKAITVQDMLAAAEGQTEETRGRRDITDDEARAALWGMRIMSFILLISAAALLVPFMEVVSSLDLIAMATEILVVIGAIDVLLAVLLFLEVTAIYSLVRVRAMIGIGFFAVYFLAGDPVGWVPLAGVVTGLVAAFLLTMLVKLWQVLPVGAVGLAGMGLFAYVMLS